MRVILDVETFRYDLLVGIKNVDTQEYQFYWNNDIKEILEHLIASNAEIISYNGNHYDLPLLYNYFFNPKNKASWYDLSKIIIESNLVLPFPKTFFNSIDLMELLATRQSLKLIEAIMGWEIRETTIDFDYEYKLTENQRREIEYYNIQDLDASEALYHKLTPYMNLRLRLAKYLGISHDYTTPLPTMMGMGLGAHRQENTPFEHQSLVLNVPIKHPVKQEMIKHLLTPQDDFSITFDIGGFSYTVGSGGIHSNIKNISKNNVWHVDVKGYYTLLQMNFDLFSRNIDETGRKKVRKMYFDRLEWKDKPLLRDDAQSLKIGLLSTWGATKNPYHILYDKYVGHSIPLYGQIFLIYLIELMADAGIEIWNANTDGLIVTGDEATIRSISEKWQKYGDFDVEIVNYKRFMAKDVNNYILGNDRNKLTVKGRDFTSLKKDWLVVNNVLVPQTKIVSQLLADILFIGEDFPMLDVEEYVRQNINKGSVEDYMFIINHTMTFKGMAFLETGEKLQKTNRAYASKNGGTVYKYKGEFTPGKLVDLDDWLYLKYRKKYYVLEYNLPLFESASEKDKQFYLVEPSKTSDGKSLLFRLADQQYKYPGLPLVKLCNQDLKNVKLEDLDIDYEYYIDEILRKYDNYYNG